MANVNINGVNVARHPKTPESRDALTYSIPFAGSLAGIGKNASYAAARRGEIPTIRFGKKLRVPKAKFLRMLAGEPPDAQTVDRTAAIVTADARVQPRGLSEK